jgi:hypothetical protein
MKALTISTLILAAFFALSCNNSANHDQVAIELNNGQKWDVNAEMSPFILGGEMILKEYDNANYKELAEQLKRENKKLIESCTMDGKSHEELHKWLHPHMQLIEDLGNADNDQQANEIIAQLNKSFQTYHNYFQ